MTNCLSCEQALDDGYLCTGCTTATAARLGRMSALYEALAPHLAPAGRRPELGSARPVEAPLPVNEQVLDLRATMHLTLEDHRAAVQADRGWGQPAIGGTVEHRVLAASRSLQHQLDWIAAEWPQAGDFAQSIRALERDVLSVLDPRPHDRRVGTCPDPCGAVLRVASGTSEVACAWCGTVWPPDTWLQLAAAAA